MVLKGFNNEWQPGDPTEIDGVQRKRMIKKDPEATIAQHFLCPNSYVTPDGRHILKGEDWKAQKQMLLERGRGKCEWGMDFLPIESRFRCWMEMHDPHHIKPRSKGRDDRLENLIGLCRYHHNLLDRRKPQWSKGKY